LREFGRGGRERAAEQDAVAAFGVACGARLDAQDQRLLAAQVDALGRARRAAAAEERHLEQRAQRPAREDVNVAVELRALDRHGHVALGPSEDVEVARQPRVAEVARLDAPRDLVREDGRGVRDVARLRRRLFERSEDERERGEEACVSGQGTAHE
jgi:hypothetical protein